MRLGIWILAVLFCRDALGYQCEIEKPPFFESIDGADIILFGAVLKIDTETGGYRSATVRVKEVVKSNETIKSKDEIKVKYLQQDGFSCEKSEGKKLGLLEKQAYLFFLKKNSNGYFTSRDAGNFPQFQAKKKKYDEVIKRYLAGEKKEDLYPLLSKGDRPK